MILLFYKQNMSENVLNLGGNRERKGINIQDFLDNNDNDNDNDNEIIDKPQPQPVIVNEQANLQKNNSDEEQKIIKEIEKSTSSFVLVMWKNKTNFVQDVERTTFLSQYQMDSLFSLIEKDYVLFRNPVVITPEEDKWCEDNLFFYQNSEKKINKKNFITYNMIKTWTKGGIEYFIKENEEFYKKMEDLTKTPILYDAWKEKSYIVNWWFDLKRNVYVQMPVEDVVHFWVFWGTWSWKTVRVKSLLSQYCKLWAKMFILAKDLNDYSDLVCWYPDNTMLYTSLNDVNTEKRVLIFLMFLILLLNERQIKFKKLGIKEHKQIFKLDNWEEKIKGNERYIVVFDEFQTFRNQLWKDLKNVFDDKMADLVAVARSYWMTIIFSTQNFQAEVLPSRIRDNLAYQVWYLPWANKFKKFFKMESNEEMFSSVKGSFAFFDSIVQSFVSSVVDTELFSIKADNEILDSKNNLTKMLLSKLNDVELETLNKKELEYFSLTESQINKISWTENYIFYLFFLHIMKNSILHFKKTIIEQKEWSSLNNFWYRRMEYWTDSLDTTVYNFLLPFIENNNNIFWNTLNVVKNNIKQKFTKDIMSEFFEDWNEIWLADEIEDFIIQTIKTELF